MAQRNAVQRGLDGDDDSGQPAAKLHRRKPRQVDIHGKMVPADNVNSSQLKRILGVESTLKLLREGALRQYQAPMQGLQAAPCFLCRNASMSSCSHCRRVACATCSSGCQLCQQLTCKQCITPVYVFCPLVPSLPETDQDWAAATRRHISSNCVRCVASVFPRPARWWTCRLSAL